MLVPIPPRPQPVLYQPPQQSLGHVLLGIAVGWAALEGLWSLFAEERSTYKYEAFVGGRRVHGGITNDLARRASEHRQAWPGVRLEQVGRRTIRKAARAWEQRNGY